MHASTSDIQYFLSLSSFWPISTFTKPNKYFWPFLLQLHLSYVNMQHEEKKPLYVRLRRIVSMGTLFSTNMSEVEAESIIYSPVNYTF